MIRRRNRWRARREALARRGRAGGLASQQVQRAKRIERGPDADTLRWRTRDDARGIEVRWGVVFQAGRTVAWCVRVSLHGRARQFDVMQGGRVRLTAGPRRVAALLRMPVRGVARPSVGAFSE